MGKLLKIFRREKIPATRGNRKPLEEAMGSEQGQMENRQVIDSLQ